MQPQDSIHQSALVRAESQLLAGKLAEAMVAIRAVLKVRPGHVGARFLLARVHSKENPQIAISLLEEMLTEQPDHIPAALLIAELLTQTGRHTAARAHLEQVARIVPPDTRLAQALALLQPATELRRLRGMDMFDHPTLAERLESLGKLEAARDTWQRIRENTPPLSALDRRIADLEAKIIEGGAMTEPTLDPLFEPAMDPQHAYQNLRQWAHRLGILHAPPKQTG